MRPFGPALWCGQHGRWEHPAGSCNTAFDPNQVDWLVPEGTLDAEPRNAGGSGE